MTIIMEIYLYLTKVTFMLKTLGKITSLYELGDVAACRRAACVLCAVHSDNDKNFAHKIIGWLQFCFRFHIPSVGVSGGRRLIHICFVGWILGWV